MNEESITNETEDMNEEIKEVTEQVELIIVEEVVQPVVDPCCEELLRLETIGIIIEMPDQGVDFE